MEPELSPSRFRSMKPKHSTCISKSMFESSKLKGKGNLPVNDEDIHFTDEKDTPVDPNLVDWDGPEDPQNPRDWSRPRKLVDITVSILVLSLRLSTTV